MRVFVLVLLCLTGLAAGHQTTPFAPGESIVLECLNSTGAWAPAIMCAESNQPLSFTFGTDSFVACGMHLNNQPLYNFITKVIEQKEGWHCRVPMSSDRVFYLPLSIALWGLVEPTHIHLNYHMNFVFHTDAGRIIGVAAYPVRDGFQYGKINSVINFHGPVKWFDRHSYKGVNEASGSIIGGAGGFGSVLGWCLFTLLVSMVAYVLVYQFVLKPQLIKKFLKAD